MSRDGRLAIHEQESEEVAAQASGWFQARGAQTIASAWRPWAQMAANDSPPPQGALQPESATFNRNVSNALLQRSGLRVPHR